jgi:hypothetical protein
MTLFHANSYSLLHKSDLIKRFTESHPHIKMCFGFFQISVESFCCLILKQSCLQLYSADKIGDEFYVVFQKVVVSGAPVSSQIYNGFARKPSPEICDDLSSTLRSVIPANHYNFLKN